MGKRHVLKQGFVGENSSLTLKLSVQTENMENKDVFGLIMALDTEYRKLENEKCEGDGRGFKKWQLSYE